MLTWCSGEPSHCSSNTGITLSTNSCSRGALSGEVMTVLTRSFIPEKPTPLALALRMFSMWVSYA